MPRGLPAHPVPNEVKESQLGRLRVEGLVENKLELGLGDLLGMPVTRLTEDFKCLEGWEVEDVEWEGVSLRHLLSLAKPLAEARCVLFESVDGFTLGMSIDEAVSRNALIAYRYWGEPIPVENGGPFRLVLTSHACYESLKWLVRVELGKECGGGTARRLALKRLAMRLMEEY